MSLDDLHSSEATLLRIMPPRAGEYSLLSFVNVLEALGDTHTFSLELASVGGRTELLARTFYPSLLEQHIESHYAGVEIDVVSPDDDPLRAGDDEVAVRRIMRPEGDEWLPFQTYDTRDSLEQADPFIDVLGVMNGANLRAGERLVSRVVLRQQPHDWSEAWRARGMSGAGSENQTAVEEQRKGDRDQSKEKSSKPSQSGSDMPFGHEFVIGGGLLLILAVLAYYVYGFWQNRELISAALLLVGGIVGLGAVGYFAWRLGFFGQKSAAAAFHDPEQVRVRISGGAFRVEVQVIAFTSRKEGNGLSRGGRMLEGVIGAYRGFDNPLGCRFSVESARELIASVGRRSSECDCLRGNELRFTDDVREYGFFNRRPSLKGGIVGVREVAAFWHIPSQSAEVASLVRLQSKRLPPSSYVMDGGALIGTSPSPGGDERDVYFPPDVMVRHHLYAARTRMGKSTLMGHVAGYEMVRKAKGQSDDALVVIDPHSDLVYELLERVPAEGVSRITLMDLGGSDRSVGVNLLDVNVFPDRDSAAESVIEVAKGTWENWGNRMEIILANAMKAMYECNEKLVQEHPSGRTQLTLLDAGRVLTDEMFRNAVLSKVSDPYLLEWWRSSYSSWSDDYGKDAVAPVLTRLANYAGSTVVRSILGQRRCTINLRDVIERGDVLLCNTNQSAVGPEVASLVGASVLKLVDSIVRKQGEERDRSQRRRVMLVVDEMQSLAGVDFQSILSEVGKFGGNLILATQSLSRLDEHSPTMRDSILANVGAVVSYQVNSIDAVRLLPELRSEYLDESDITGLPVHNAYVRVTTGGSVQAPFSMKVMPPVSGDNLIERAVNEGLTGYTRPTDVVLGELDRAMEDGVSQFRRQVERNSETSSRDGSQPINLGHLNTGKENSD